MQTGHCSIEYRGNPPKKPQTGLTLACCVGAGLFCAVFAYGLAGFLTP